MRQTIADLAPGQAGTVAGFSEIDAITERLMHLGLTEGADVKLIRLAPGGDPIEIDVMGYALSLRKHEASMILVDGIEPAA
tara:strand:+ start:269 stop:511 length:243 start_codon:yes stop_codon:yes gene_type:complete